MDDLINDYNDLTNQHKHLELSHKELVEKYEHLLSKYNQKKHENKELIYMCKLLSNIDEHKYETIINPKFLDEKFSDTFISLFINLDKFGLYDEFTKIAKLIKHKHTEEFVKFHNDMISLTSNLTNDGKNIINELFGH